MRVTLRMRKLRPRKVIVCSKPASHYRGPPDSKQRSTVWLSMLRSLTWSGPQRRERRLKGNKGLISTIRTRVRTWPHPTPKSQVSSPPPHCSRMLLGHFLLHWHHRLLISYFNKHTDLCKTTERLPNTSPPSGTSQSPRADKACTSYLELKCLKNRNLCFDHRFISRAWNGVWHTLVWSTNI